MSLGFLVQSPLGHSRTSLTCTYSFPSGSIPPTPQVRPVSGFESPYRTLTLRACCDARPACGNVVEARLTADIRVIISAYRTENISDDHPYILRYTPGGLG